jgi:hypothetical protein
MRRIALTFIIPLSLLASIARAQPAENTDVSDVSEVDDTSSVTSKSATEQPAFDVLGEVFSEYSYSEVASQKQNAFEMTRAEVGIQRFGKHTIGGEIRLETIRSAGPNSFSGIDEDSLLVRLKRAWGFALHRHGDFEAEARLGLVPTPWIEAVEVDYGMRFLAPSVGERLLFYDTSDIGANVRLAYADRVHLSYALLNGEGRNQREQNRGKTSQGVVTIKALSTPVAGEPLTLRVHLGGQEGSQGAGAARNHRLSAAATFVHPRVALGVEVHQSLGFEEVSTRKSRAASLWLRAHYKHLGATLRIDDHEADLDREMTGSRFYLAGLFAMKRASMMTLRLGLVARIERSEANATVLPGLAFAGSQNALLLVLGVNFGSEETSL